MEIKSQKKTFQSKEKKKLLDCEFVFLLLDERGLPNYSLNNNSSFTRGCPCNSDLKPVHDLRLFTGSCCFHQHVSQVKKQKDNTSFLQKLQFFFTYLFYLRWKVLGLHPKGTFLLTLKIYGQYQHTAKLWKLFLQSWALVAENFQKCTVTLTLTGVQTHCSDP